MEISIEYLFKFNLKKGKKKHFFKELYIQRKRKYVCHSLQWYHCLFSLSPKKISFFPRFLGFCVIKRKEKYYLIKSWILLIDLEANQYFRYLFLVFAESNPSNGFYIHPSIHPSINVYTFSNSSYHNNWVEVKFVWENFIPPFEWWETGETLMIKSFRWCRVAISFRSSKHSDFKCKSKISSCLQLEIPLSRFSCAILLVVSSDGSLGHLSP